MKLTGLFSALFCTAVAVAATPSTEIGDLPIFKRNEGPTVPDSFIVVLKDKTDRTAHLSMFGKGVRRIRYKYSAFNGYSGVFDEASLDQLRNDASVASIEPDYVVNISYTVSPFKTSAPPARHRPRASLLCTLFGNCTPTPPTPEGSNGTGVDIYGLDTGIYIEHDDVKGRAVHGKAFGYNTTNDGNGHGTHTASIAAGTEYGVAKGASLIGVKVLGDDGSGVYSDVIAGIEWVIQRANASGRPSVINCSLGGPQSNALNIAVRSAVDSGVHFVAAAGNSATNANATSPANEESIVTVGAVDSSNKMAYFSNFGSVLDVFALGVNVKAAYIGSPQTTRSLSGTSMASPAVAGTLAVELSKYGKMSPANLQNSLKQNAKAVVTGQPQGTTNLLASKW